MFMEMEPEYELEDPDCFPLREYDGDDIECPADIIWIHDAETYRRSRHPYGGVRLSLITPESVTWLSPGRLAAGKVHVLEGAPGVAKSTLTTDWAARISQGNPLPDGEATEPGGVILLCGEDGIADTVNPRLKAAGADLERVVALTEKPCGNGYLLPRDIDCIEQIVIDERAKLLVIDPLTAYLEPHLSTNVEQEVRQVMSALAVMTERTGVAAILVRHQNKRVGISALYRGIGSIGIAGAARIVLLLAQDPGAPDRRILARVKGNLGAPPPSLAFTLEPVQELGVTRILYQGHVEFCADELVEAEPGSRRSERDRGIDWTRRTLKDGPIPITELVDRAKSADISEATLRRAMKEIGVISKKDSGHNGRWLKMLPDSREGA